MLPNRLVKFLSGLFFLLFAFEAKAQVFINEVSSANSSGLADEEGAFNDWIEFYNSGSTPVNLNNYILLREESKNNQWKFPAVIVQPNSYLTVFASGKDHKPVINHWETAAAANDIWKYKPGTSEPDSNWREINYNDNGWLQGKGGIGYGDGDDSTIISPTGSLYMRAPFQIADTAKVSLAILSRDCRLSCQCYRVQFQFHSGKQQRHRHNP